MQPKLHSLRGALLYTVICGNLKCWADWKEWVRGESAQGEKKAQRKGYETEGGEGRADKVKEGENENE